LITITHINKEYLAMGVIYRGIKNAFRNSIRTGSIALILGLSIGLSLIMLIAGTTIQTKIDSVKASIGNTITISPAGARGFQGGGEPLTGAMLKPVASLANVVSLQASLSDRLTSADTSLVSAVDAGSLGRRFRRQNSDLPANSLDTPTSPQPTRAFTLPVSVTGVDIPTAASANGNTLKLTSGKLYSAGSNDNVAVIGTALAAKNSLSAGQTFKAYNTDITVAGIFDAGNNFANNGVFMPLSSLQRLSSQPDDITSVVVQVNSISNVSSVSTAISTILGSKADVVSTQDTSQQAITPLESIKTISQYSLFGALGSGAVIIFLSMLMIVRERRREIGVLKAIGASNANIVLQFISESLTITVLGSVIGIVISVLLSNTIIQALATSTTNSTAPGGGSGFGREGGGFGRQALWQLGSTLNPRMVLASLQAHVGLEIVLYGFGIALLIAIIGSAIPAWLTAKVRPAEVMRGE
jgi:putative ABC transport system permease protein